MTEPEPDSLGGAQKLKRWLRPFMLLVAAAFVLVTAFDLSRRWEGERVEVDALYALLSLAPLLAGSLLQGFGWIGLVERMAGRATPRLPALGLYLDSQLARYTPGKVGLPLVRMEGAPRLGLTRRLVGVSVLIEMLAWTATGAVVGFALLALFGAESSGLAGLLGRWALPLLFASVLGLFGLCALDRRRLPARLRSLVAIDGSGPLAPPLLLLLQLAYFLTWAAHGYALALALGATPREALGTMGFSPLASVLGFVALAAPAGVGVREAVLIAGLSPVVGGPGAVAGAILARVVSLAADVGVWLAVRLGLRRSLPDGTG